MEDKQEIKKLLGEHLQAILDKLNPNLELFVKRQHDSQHNPLLEKPDTSIPSDHKPTTKNNTKQPPKEL